MVPLRRKDMSKSDAFAVELGYIENQALRDLAHNLLEQLPDYFYKVAASSTGKYHPSYALGEGGLVRHTKAAVRIAVEMLRLEMYKTIAQAHDYIIIALLVHDGWKHGPITEDGSYSQWTTFTHPKVCADWLRNQNIGAFQPNLDYIASLVETHMGEWNLNYRSGAIELPKPSTQEQCFVHLCDYLASRKCLEFNETIPFEV